MCLTTYLTPTRETKNKYRGVAQLVGHLLWEQDAASSSLATPTIQPPVAREFFSLQAFLLFLRLFRGDFCFYFDDYLGITGLSRAPVSSLRMCAANNGKDESAVHALKNLLYLLVYRVRLARHIIVDRFLKNLRF